MAEFELHGATIDQVARIIQMTVLHGISDVRKDKIYYSYDLAGINLRVRLDFKDAAIKGSEGARSCVIQRFRGDRLSLNGNGWMIVFQVSVKRPSSMATGVPSYAMRLVNGYGSQPMCLHTMQMFSPDAFIRDMALLRLFAADWLEA